MIRDGVTDAMPVQKYDIRRPEPEGGGFEERFWSPVNSPVFGRGDQVAYVIHRVEDVTDFLHMKQAEDPRHQLAEHMRSRAEALEAEVYQRTREVAETSRKLKEANSELAENLAKIKATEEQLRELQAMADRDRIASDLNEQVIGRLSALSMHVAGLTPLAPEFVAARLHEAVRELDDVIIGIRAVIFDLRERSRPSVPRSASEPRAGER